MVVQLTCIDAQNPFDLLGTLFQHFVGPSSRGSQHQNQSGLTDIFFLGNDDGDSDTPTAPVKTVDKTSTHTVKRNTDGLGSATQAPARGGSRRGGIGGNEGGTFRRQTLCAAISRHH